MIERSKIKLTYVVEPKSGDGVVTQDKRPFFVDIARQFPKMQLCGKDRENVAISFRLHVTTPKVDLQYFRVMK